MKGICLRFYTHDLRKHQGILLYEWLLEHARKQGIPGGSALRGVAGYGRHGVLHEHYFFELGSSVPIEVVFIMTSSQAEAFLCDLSRDKISLVYTQTEVEYGATC
jgi:PII-like signaling protein